MRLALAQINPVVADIDGNRRRIAQRLAQAADAGADVALLTELAIVGYPPRDWLLKPHFVAAAQDAVQQLARESPPGLAALVGFPEPNPVPNGRPLFNSLALCRGGRVDATFRKSLLPTYDVFDEARYFEPAPGPAVAVFPGPRALRAGLCICEDLWNDADFVPRPLYHENPMESLCAAGIDVVFNISASPFTVGKQAFRRRLFGGQAAKHRTPIVVVNQVGGNDELVFDGASCAFDAAGRLVAQARAFDEDLLLIDIDAVLGSATVGGARPRIEPYPDDIASIHDALVLGTRDYLRKCGFASAVVGLSGGIDSAVVAALAVEALGPRAVRGVALPSRYNPPESLADARELAANLGMPFDVIHIEELHAAAERTLAPFFPGLPPDTTEENIQARLRGNLLMALSNKFGSLLLTTGNKSELAVGYCTLYGDMCGGLAVISDVPKTTVYALGKHINERAGRPLIPPRVFEKPPSAELKPGQTDQDTLPPYDVLDRIIHEYVEAEYSAERIIAGGLDPQVVRRTVRMIDRNEYKRRQAAPGLKVTSRAFGIGRRMPIAAWPNAAG